MSLTALGSNTPLTARVEQKLLSDRNFRYLAGLVESLTGIRISEKKRTMLEGRIRRRAHDVGLENLNAYCEYLLKPENIDREIVHFFDVVTTNKTDFFREPGHFEVLCKTLLPNLKEPRQTFKVWSAACSIGAEPYTIAMVLQEFARTKPGFSFEIVATDLSTSVLAKAHNARFSDSMLGPIPVDLRNRYVLRHRDPQRKEFRITPQLRSRVSFARLNLMDETYSVDTNFDLIFCRNALIYFDRPNQTRVLERLCDHLVPGGHLFLGHSETIAGMRLPLETVANTVFRRR